MPDFFDQTTSPEYGGCFLRRGRVGDMDADFMGRLRPGTLLRQMQEAGADHAEELNIGRAMTREKGSLWVIVRTSLEAERLPVLGEEYEILTWPGQTRKVFMPRYFELRVGGETLVRACSVYLLISAESRRMLNPAQLGVGAEAVSRPGQLPEPPLRLPFPDALPETELRRPRYSELDTNVHLNNSHYIDWAEDLLCADYHRSHALSSLWVDYRMEVLADDELSLSYAREGDILFLRGESSRGNHFSLRAGYAEG